MQSLFFGSLGRYVSINGMTGIWETERKREGEIEDKGKKEQGLTLDVFLLLYHFFHILCSCLVIRRL